MFVWFLESLDKQQTTVKSKKALYQSVLEAAKRKPRHLISRPFKSSKKFIKRAGKASDSSDECHEKKVFYCHSQSFYMKGIVLFLIVMVIFLKAIDRLFFSHFGY